jgi:hypothetical protein
LTLTIKGDCTDSGVGGVGDAELGVADASYISIPHQSWQSLNDKKSPAADDGADEFGAMDG